MKGQQLRSELLKQTTTRTNLGLLVGMLGLAVFAVMLHGLTLPADDLGRLDNQLMVFGRGETMGVLFATLLGAVSMTSEFRHGTIRPTFLAMPRRGRVVGAKLAVSTLLGAGLGLVACAVAASVGVAALGYRGIDVQLDTGDYALLLIGGAAGAALWAAIGVGLGAIVRNQVPTLIGIAAFQLFVEGLLVGDVADVTNVGRFMPGWAAAALSGQDPDILLAPIVAFVVLVAYAVVAAVAGLRATDRYDVA